MLSPFISAESRHPEMKLGFTLHLLSPWLEGNLSKSGTAYPCSPIYIYRLCESALYN